MANSPRVVCWANLKEWMDIYEWLYSFHDADLQRKAVDRVMAWKSRSGGKLPLAIETTADLVMAHLADSFTPEYQLVVSMALVRFVNGMADLNQRGVYARSVQAIAEEIGLPDWLVDLRHEATHASLPSQHTLRAGVNLALSWLREEYWEAQVKMHEDSKYKLLEMLKKYCEVLMTKSGKKTNVEKLRQRNAVLAQDIVNFIATNNLWTHLQMLLLKDNLLTDVIKQDGNTVDEPCSNLTEELIRIWRPILEAADREAPDFITHFLVSILDPQPERQEPFDLHVQSDSHSLALALWVMQSSTKSNGVFTPKRPWLSLLEVCLKNPNPFTQDFVSLILDETPYLSDGLRKKISSLLKINVNQRLLDNGPNPSYECKTLQDVENSGLNIVQQPKNSNLKQDVGWSQSSSESKWSLIPFGEVLGCESQTVNYLELPQTLNQIPNNRNPTSSKVFPDDISENMDNCETEEWDSGSDNENITLDESLDTKMEICLF